MKTLEQVIEEMGLKDVIIKPEEWKSISKTYAKAKLEEASERVVMIVEYRGKVIYDKQTRYIASEGEHIEIDKQSILNTPLD